MPRSDEAVAGSRVGFIDLDEEFTDSEYEERPLLRISSREGTKPILKNRITPEVNDSSHMYQNSFRTNSNMNNYFENDTPASIRESYYRSAVEEKYPRFCTKKKPFKDNKRHRFRAEKPAAMDGYYNVVDNFAGNKDMMVKNVDNKSSEELSRYSGFTQTEVADEKRSLAQGAAYGRPGFVLTKAEQDTTRTGKDFNDRFDRTKRKLFNCDPLGGQKGQLDEEAGKGNKKRFHNDMKQSDPEAEIARGGLQRSACKERDATQKKESQEENHHKTVRCKKSNDYTFLNEAEDFDNAFAESYNYSLPHAVLIKKPTEERERRKKYTRRKTEEDTLNEEYISLKQLQGIQDNIYAETHVSSHFNGGFRGKIDEENEESVLSLGKISKFRARAQRNEDQQEENCYKYVSRQLEDARRENYDKHLDIPKKVLDFGVRQEELFKVKPKVAKKKSADQVDESCIKMKVAHHKRYKENQHFNGILEAKEIGASHKKFSEDSHDEYVIRGRENKLKNDARKEPDKLVTYNPKIVQKYYVPPKDQSKEQSNKKHQKIDENAKYAAKQKLKPFQTEVETIKKMFLDDKPRDDSYNAPMNISWENSDFSRTREQSVEGSTVITNSKDITLQRHSKITPYVEEKDFISGNKHMVSFLDKLLEEFPEYDNVVPDVFEMPDNGSDDFPDDCSDFLDDVASNIDGHSINSNAKVTNEPVTNDKFSVSSLDSSRRNASSPVSEEMKYKMKEALRRPRTSHGCQTKTRF